VYGELRPTSLSCCMSLKMILDEVVDTGFIAANPYLMAPLREQDCAQKMLKYIEEVIVNGTPKELGDVGDPPSSVLIPEIKESAKKRTKSLKKIFDEEGPEAFAQAVLTNDELLITDTTWRDVHQSLLATRLCRTIDSMLNIAPASKEALANAHSLECWGVVTFDVAMRFLRKCPWD
jgi:pyruvate carboxylase